MIINISSKAARAAIEESVAGARVSIAASGGDSWWSDPNGKTEGRAFSVLLSGPPKKKEDGT